MADQDYVDIWNSRGEGGQVRVLNHKTCLSIDWCNEWNIGRK